MTVLRTDTAAVATLGQGIVALAHDVDTAVSAVAVPLDVGEPSATASALGDFAQAYRRSTRRLRDDVLALGRLTEAVAAEYDAVEAAATRLFVGDVAQALSGGRDG